MSRGLPIARAPRHTSLAAFAATALVAASLVLIAQQPAEAEVTVPAPLPPTLVWEETFSAPYQGTYAPGANNPAMDLTAYRSVTGLHYTADRRWQAVEQICDGWILNSSSNNPHNVTSPSDANPSGDDAGCGSPGGTDGGKTTRAGWYFLRYLAYVLGLAAGQTPVEAMYNNAVAAETNVAQGAATPTDHGPLEFGMSGAASAIPGHYYVASADFAALHCYDEKPAGGRTDPSEELILTTADGGSWSIASGINPCDTTQALSLPGFNPFPTNTTTITTGAGSLLENVGEVHVSRLSGIANQGSQAIQINSNAALGLQILNNTETNTGNDVAFDNPRIMDVTPALYKNFDPGLINPNGVSTLTFTVVNSTDLLAKNGWSFTDILPAGVVVAHFPNVTSTCDAQVLNGTSGNPVTGGDTAISVTGNLGAGAPGYCQVSVDVTVPSTSLTPEQVAAISEPGGQTRIPNSINLGSMCLSRPEMSVDWGSYGTPFSANTGSGYGLVGCPFDELKVENPQLKVDVGPPTLTTQSLSGNEYAALTWTITVLNSSNLAAGDVVVTDVLGSTSTSAGLTAPSWATPTIGSLVPAGSVVNGSTYIPGPSHPGGVSSADTVWFIPTLAPGQAAQITVTALIADGSGTALAASSLTNALLTDPTFSSTVTISAPNEPQICSYDLSSLYPPGGDPVLCRAIDVTDSSGAISASLSVAQDSDRWDQELTKLPLPGLTLTKSPSTDAAGFDKVLHFIGDTVTYTFTARNTGNTQLTNVNLVDYLELSDYSHAWCANAISEPVNPASVTMNIGDSIVCTANYTLTASDIEHHNEPVASVLYPDGIGNGCPDMITGIYYPDTESNYVPDGVGNGSLYNNALVFGTPFLSTSLNGSGGTIQVTGTNTAPDDTTVSTGLPITNYLYPQPINCPAAAQVQIVSPGDLQGPWDTMPYTGADRQFPYRTVGLAVLSAACTGLAFTQKRRPVAG